MRTAWNAQRYTYPLFRRASHELVASAFLIAILSAPTEAHLESFDNTKNHADDDIYMDHRVTLYCGCDYVSLGNSRGSGTVDMAACGIDTANIPDRYTHVTGSIQWEHIVPASRMTARGFSCWSNPDRFTGCTTGRRCCEDNDYAKAAIFDLHNLAPAIGQINQIRQNDHYGETGGVPGQQETWPGCDTVHLDSRTTAATTS